MLTNGANFTIERMIKVVSSDNDTYKPLVTTTTCNPSSSNDPGPGAAVMIPVSDDYQLLLRSNPPSTDPKHATQPTRAMIQKHGSSHKHCNSYIVPPSQTKPSVLTEQFTADIRNFAMVSYEQFSKCVNLSTKEVLAIGGADITCVGCRKGIETLLDNLKQSQFSKFEKFEFASCSKIKILYKHSDIKSADSLIEKLSVSKFRVKEIFEALPKKNKTRCVYHSVNHDLGGNRESQIQWNVLWENTTPSCRKEILRISESELKTSQEMFTKKHKFCDDCQYHLSNAFKLLFEPENAPKYEDYNPDTYQFLSMETCATTGERFVCVAPETSVLADMMDRLKNQMNTSNPNEERHARTLDVAQKEAVLCIAMFLYKRVQAIVMKFSAFVACVELLPHVVWLTFRSKLEAAVEDVEGLMRIDKTLKEIALVDAKHEAQKERKREKKRNRKLKLKQMYEQNLDVTEMCSIETYDLEQNMGNNGKVSRNCSNSKTRRESLSPPGNNFSDGGYSTSESGNSPREDEYKYPRDTSCNLTRRKGNKMNTSSSGISTLSCSSSPESSSSPASTNNSSPVRRRGAVKDCPNKSASGKPINLAKTKTSSSSEDEISKTMTMSSSTRTHTESANKGVKKADCGSKQDKKSNGSSAEKREINRTPGKAPEGPSEAKKAFCMDEGSDESLVISFHVSVPDNRKASQKVPNSKNANKQKNQLITNAPNQTFIPQAEIDAFKKKHADYLKQRESIRQKFRAGFECKLKTNGLL
ncbi:uncharacterized protein LOC142344928 [Convolutriloba macropyga]|uniref:uncharacterized protein LOC142344928 n=1 Tax=Convolutriloba macropyga TaxID=536237 RepID=UPI003F51C131